MSDKKVLFIIPDYSYTTLKMLKVFEDLGYEITIATPYQFNLLLNTILKLPIKKWSFFKKISRRQHDWFLNKPKKYKIISISFIRFLLQVFAQNRKKIVFTNTLRNLTQSAVLKKIDFNKFNYVYAFDTCALPFFNEAKKNKLKTILEYRGTEIDFVLELNDKLNTRYGLSLDSIKNYNRTEGLTNWYNKIRTEPKLADILVVYSEFQKSQLNHPNTIKIPIASKFRKTATIKSTENIKIKFLYTGRIVYTKGIQILLEAWEKLNKTHEINGFELNIVGGTVKNTEHLMNALPDNIIYHNYLFDNELKKMFEECHVLIHPTFFESFGMVIMEALSYNMPIITTKNCGAAEFINDGKTGYLCEDIFSSEELAQKIANFILAPELINEMSNNISKIAILSKEDIRNDAANQFKLIL